MGIHPVVRMTLTALVVTGVIFLEIFACVPDDWIMLVCLIPLLLTPVPLVLMRCCGDGDGILSSSPKGRHWAEVRLPIEHTTCPEKKSAAPFVG